MDFLCTIFHVMTMQPPLNISTELLLPGGEPNRIFDMTGRCAFAVCIEGDFDIRIMHKDYRVKSRSVLICMPFVNVEVIKVNAPSKVIICGTDLENVLAIINRTLSTGNLLSLRIHPVVSVDPAQLRYITSTIDEYLDEIADIAWCENNQTCGHINRSIIEARSQLIVAQALKLYFTNMPVDAKAQNHRDMVFQHFMIDLYANFRQNRTVKFYAMRSGLSLKYFSTLVRELSGAQPSEWIDTVVVGEAKSLLLNPERNIKEIAASLNFPDGPTFTKFFVRAAGITPKKFRRLATETTE